MDLASRSAEAPLPRVTTAVSSWSGWPLWPLHPADFCVPAWDVCDFLSPGYDATLHEGREQVPPKRFNASNLLPQYCFENTIRIGILKFLLIRIPHS